MLDNVYRGPELVGGQGGEAPDFMFAALYSVHAGKMAESSKPIPVADKPAPPNLQTTFLLCDGPWLIWEGCNSNCELVVGSSRFGGNVRKVDFTPSAKIS